MDQLQQLFPQVGPAPFPGAYLAHDLRHASRHPGRPFVYANFVVSLDGRIAVPAADGQGLIVPKQIANERDWRLYQELAAQADLIISSGRYLRDWAAGRAQEILQVDDPRFYLTHANRLLGGNPFASIVEGPLFAQAVDMRLNTLYFDPAGLNGLGQLFISYDRV